MAMADEPTLTFDQVGCARCDADGHPAITFTRLKRPVEVADHVLTHWASCPTNGEPILLEAIDTP